MIMDKLNTFCEDEPAFGTAATRLEGDVIDLIDVRDIGNGQPLYLIVTITTAWAGGTSANFQLASDATDAIATNGTASIHGQTGAIPVANLTAGKTFVIPAMIEGTAYERYLGVLVTTVGTTTAGAFTAFLSIDPTGWKAYPEAVS